MAAQELAVEVGVAPACEALGVPRATFYRRQRPPLSANMTETPAPLGITVGRCEVRTHDGRERRDEIQWDSCPRTGG